MLKCGLKYMTTTYQHRDNTWNDTQKEQIFLYTNISQVWTRPQEDHDGVWIGNHCQLRKIMQQNSWTVKCTPLDGVVPFCTSFLEGKLVKTQSCKTRSDQWLFFFFYILNRKQQSLGKKLQFWILSNHHQLALLGVSFHLFLLLLRSKYQFSTLSAIY